MAPMKRGLKHYHGDSLAYRGHVGLKNGPDEEGIETNPDRSPWARDHPPV